ncbi:MAG: filamentous hemagglutinin N-terminal domain-containing protein [Haliea sp.]|uniref:two-partner secretion domain-containing protein n=1 Tax=Haliea sp. TaxID=1932666 RepID=UPI0032EAC87E
MIHRPDSSTPQGIPAVRRPACIGLLSALLVSGLTGPGVRADAVFDGTIGPNLPGTMKAGNFEITQQDGQVAGSNLFHSFASFGVSQGEMATFTHQSTGIEHIVARVTGQLPSGIFGTLQVRRASAGVLSPTSAALWLLNPSGIIIGDGAAFDAQSTFVLTTANRLGFANGDSFYSHEPVLSSILSVAEPTSFGFLDRQALPANVSPAGIAVTASDAANANTPLFLSNMTLVGTSIDPQLAGIRFTGDVATAFDPTALFAPDDSTQMQALNLRLAALGVGGSVSLDNNILPSGLSAERDTALGSIQLQNSNLFVSDSGIAPVSRFAVLAANLSIDNSYIETAASTRPVPVSIRATGGVTLLDSVLRTSTASGSEAGDILVDTPNYAQFGGLVSSRNLDLGAPTGDPGNILFGTSASLPMENFLLQQGQILAFSTQLNRAGDLLLNVQGDLMLTGSADARANLASISGGSGGSGDILLAGARIKTEYSDIFSAGLNPVEQRSINLQAGAGGLTMINTTLLGVTSAGRNGASIGLFSAGDISLISTGETSSISTGTGGDLQGGDIFIAADGNLLLDGSFDISSNSLGDSSAVGEGGIVSLSGRRVELNQPGTDGATTSISSVTTSAGAGGTIFISAVDDLVIRGQHDLSSFTVGPGDSGAVLLDAATIAIESPLPTTLSTSSVGSGNAGIISLSARDRLSLSGAAIDSVAAADGAAGFLLISAATVSIDRTTLATTTRSNDVDDIPAQILIDAGETLQISESTLQSNATGRSPAGQVSVAAGESIRVDNVSIQTATAGEGVTGSIFLTSGGDILLTGENTELLSNSLGASAAGDVRVVATNTLQFEGGGFIQTSAVGSGDAGTILLAADKVSLRLARIEGTSDNAGGGDVNIFGRDIRLDGDLDSGGIVFISASSQSSDSAGNGGSITLGNPLAPATLVFVRNSGLSASANAGNGGLININAENFLRDARSIFQVTSTLGAPGSLEINAPEQDISAAVSELDVDILDATDLIQDRCAVSPEDASSLVIVGGGVVAETYDGYLTGGFRPGGTRQARQPSSAGYTGANAGQHRDARGMEAKCQHLL